MRRGSACGGGWSGWRGTGDDVEFVLDDLALISAQEYKRLRQLDQKSVYACELPEEVINELGTVPIPKETHEFDDEYHHT